MRHVCRYIMDEIKDQFNLDRFQDNWTLKTCVWRFGKCTNHTNNAWNSSTNIAKRNFYLEGNHLEKFSNESIMSIALGLDQRIEEKFGYKTFLDKKIASSAYNKDSRCAVHWPESYLWSQRKFCSLKVVLPRIFWWKMKNIFDTSKYNWQILLNFSKHFHWSTLARFANIWPPRFQKYAT